MHKEQSYRPAFIIIAKLRNLFPQSKPGDTPWFPAEKVASEDVNLYDETGEWDHRLNLYGLTPADFAMDADEEADITRINASHLDASMAETFSNSNPYVLLPSYATNVIPPLCYDIICTHCGRTTPYVKPKNA